jgi:hypothetical protein
VNLETEMAKKGWKEDIGKRSVSLMDYPAQIDCVWLASDNVGKLAAMITAGEGPIPAGALGDNFDVVATERRLLELPVIGQAHVIWQVPDPISFTELSKRGLFVYDWTDVHLPQAQMRSAYELVCAPAARLDLGALPVALRDLASAVDTIFGAAFVNIGYLGVCRLPGL